MEKNPKVKTVLLIIRDGWGINSDPELEKWDAVKQASTPCSDALSAEWPTTKLGASGLDVGLPEGIMGNSEVGHQNIGAGRIVDQELVRIDKAFAEVKLFENSHFREALETVKSGRGKLHLMGLVSDAGVHAMLEHLYGLLELLSKDDLDGSQVMIHAFTDGRDTPPTSGLKYIRALEAKCRETGVGRIAGVCGRFWAMDRDKRWDRVERAWKMLRGIDAARANSAEEAIQNYYDNPLDKSRKGDEFVIPTWIVDEDDNPLGTIQDGDAVLFFNFRGDRPRELCYAFLNDKFEGFDRGPKPEITFMTMTDYEKGLCERVLFPKPPKMSNILGSYLSALGITQFRCAETEKFPHVTFFFNDYREEPFEGEMRELIPSPQVSTYDQQPEMSAPKVIEAAEKAILSGNYGFLVVNFANPDMVGHTGSMEAAVQACETTDRGVARLLKAVDSLNGRAIITADHGNCETMFTPDTGSAHTAHTLNPVELVIYGEDCRNYRLRQEDTRLGDIAPTVLELMGLPAPAEMTGRSLITK